MTALLKGAASTHGTYHVPGADPALPNGGSALVEQTLFGQQMQQGESHSETKSARRSIADSSKKYCSRSCRSSTLRPVEMVARLTEALQQWHTNASFLPGW